MMSSKIQFFINITRNIANKVKKHNHPHTAHPKHLSSTQKDALTFFMKIGNLQFKQTLKKTCQAKINQKFLLWQKRNKFTTLYEMLN